MPLMNGIRSILLFVPSLSTCVSILCLDLFASTRCALLGFGLLFLSTGLSVLSSLYSQDLSHCDYCTLISASRDSQSRLVHGCSSMGDCPIPTLCQYPKDSRISTCEVWLLHNLHCSEVLRLHGRKTGDAVTM